MDYCDHIKTCPSCQQRVRQWICYGWAAGFMDGEGSFRIICDGRYEQKNYGGAVQVNQTIERIYEPDRIPVSLSRFAKIIDVKGGLSFHNQDECKGYMPNHHLRKKESHKVEDICRTLLPFLCLKHDVAELVMYFVRRRTSSFARRRTLDVSDKEFWWAAETLNLKGGKEGSTNKDGSPKRRAQDLTPEDFQRVDDILDRARKADAEYAARYFPYQLPGFKRSDDHSDWLGDIFGS